METVLGASDVGGEQAFVARAELKSALTLEHYLGLGLTLPFAQTRGGGPSLGNPTLSLYVVPWRHVGRTDASLWLELSGSTPLFADSDRRRDVGLATSGFWVTAPGLHLPGTHTLRSGLAVDVRRGRMTVRAAAFFDRYFKDTDGGRGFLSGRARYIGDDFRGGLELSSALSMGANAGHSASAITLSAGFQGNSGGSLDFLFYAPVRHDSDPFYGFGLGLRAQGAL